MFVLERWQFILYLISQTVIQGEVTFTFLAKTVFLLKNGNFLLKSTDTERVMLESVTCNVLGNEMFTHHNKHDYIK